MNIGQRIKQRREELGLSVEDVAKRLNKHRATIYRYETDAIDKFPTNVLEPLAVVLQTTPAALMGWDDDNSNQGNSLPSGLSEMFPTTKKPRLGAIACGEPILASGDYESFDDVPAFIQCDFTLLCRGDSMIEARIHDGDVVCIRAQPKVENGQIAAVCVDGEYESEATLKRVHYLPNGIALMPANQKYEPMFFTGEDAKKVRIIGLATHFIGKID